MQGTIVKVAVEEGQSVSEGEVIVALVPAHRDRRGALREDLVRLGQIAARQLRPDVSP